jgi:hypothetical protein
VKEFTPPPSYPKAALVATSAGGPKAKRVFTLTKKQHGGLEAMKDGQTLIG